MESPERAQCALGVRRRHWRRARCWGFRAAAPREWERAAAEAASKRFAGGKTLPKAGFTPAEEDKLWGSRSARSALWGAAAALAACEVLGI